MGRHPAFDLAGEGLRGPPQLGEAPPRLDPDVDVHALAAEVFGQPVLRARRDFPHDVGDPAHGGELAPRHGIQVDAPLIGLFESARREFHGWNSTVDICTAQITLASSVTHSSSACRP